MLVKEALQKLQSMNPDETICMVLWQIDDVKSQSGHISDEDAAGVLDAMENNHDATLGITWDTIDCYLDQRQLEAEAAL